MLRLRRGRGGRFPHGAQDETRFPTRASLKPCSAGFGAKFPSNSGGRSGDPGWLIRLDNLLC
jgi:hypothetical protein